MPTSTPGPGPRDRFTTAYQRVVDQWPVKVTGLDAPTDYGTTHLLAAGDETAPALLLLPGGSATATVWSAVAGGLAGAYRVVAVDPIGQPGLSTPGQRPLKTTADLGSWLDQVLDHLGVPRAAVAGHSYGAWLALRYALHAPGRVSRLVLLDPTTCFVPPGVSYRLHSIPLFTRPSADRARRLLAWETGGRPLDPAWLAVAAAGADLGRPHIVLPSVPKPAELAGMAAPVLVVVAARSRAHDPAQVAARARQRLPEATVETMAQATHHTIPTEDADELTGYMAGFLASGTPAAGA
ncbi:MAG TPA: alpha/beta hydrolase [Streptosporangiaceae bacterium]|jgi:pimeloyl-ACP methyl ester carboxylesterase